MKVSVATIHWIGGFESRHEFARPVRTYDQLHEGDLLMKRIAELREAGKTAEQTAETLRCRRLRSHRSRQEIQSRNHTQTSAQARSSG